MPQYLLNSDEYGALVAKIPVADHQHALDSITKLRTALLEASNVRCVNDRSDLRGRRDLNYCDDDCPIRNLMYGHPERKTSPCPLPKDWSK